VASVKLLLISSSGPSSLLSIELHWNCKSQKQRKEKRRSLLENNKSSSLEQLIWNFSRAAKTKPKEELKKILICLS
jgi:hypothetical protein